MINAHVPTPDGAIVATAEPLDLASLRILDLHATVYVNRSDLHALGKGDVQRVVGAVDLEKTLRGFGARGIKIAYVRTGSPWNRDEVLRRR